MTGACGHLAILQPSSFIAWQVACEHLAVLRLPDPRMSCTWLLSTSRMLFCTNSAIPRHVVAPSTLPPSALEQRRNPAHAALLPRSAESAQPTQSFPGPGEDLLRKHVGELDASHWKRLSIEKPAAKQFLRQAPRPPRASSANNTRSNAQQHGYHLPIKASKHAQAGSCLGCCSRCGIFC